MFHSEFDEVIPVRSRKLGEAIDVFNRLIMQSDDEFKLDEDDIFGVILCAIRGMEATRPVEAFVIDAVEYYFKHERAESVIDDSDTDLDIIDIYSHLACRSFAYTCDVFYSDFRGFYISSDDVKDIVFWCIANLNNNASRTRYDEELDISEEDYKKKKVKLFTKLVKYVYNTKFSKPRFKG